VGAITHALRITGSMTWEITWALILGFTLSAIIQAVVNIAASRNMTTVAEGVETQLQKELLRALGVRQAIRERVLRRQKRHDALARHVPAEIRDEMPQVVFLRQADRAVGEEDVGALARQPPHRVVRVDPRVHALVGGELRPRRPQLGGKIEIALFVLRSGPNFENHGDHLTPVLWMRLRWASFRSAE